jgi:hypothetical protein
LTGANEIAGMQNLHRLFGCRWQIRTENRRPRDADRSMATRMPRSVEAGLQALPIWTSRLS